MEISSVYGRREVPHPYNTQPSYSSCFNKAIAKFAMYYSNFTGHAGDTPLSKSSSTVQ